VPPYLINGIAVALKGRKFYGCCFPADQRCKFFLWAEVFILLMYNTINQIIHVKDNPALVSLAVDAVNGLSMGSDDKLLHAFNSYKTKLNALTTVELKEEIKLTNRKNRATDSKSTFHCTDDKLYVL